MKDAAATVAKSLLSRAAIKHCTTVNAEQLGQILQSLGGSSCLVEGLEELLTAGGWNTDSIQLENFLEWVLIEDGPICDTDAASDIEHRVTALFQSLSDGKSNVVDANIIVEALLELDFLTLSEEDILSTLRDVDKNCDGFILCEEFLQLLRAPPPPEPDFLPHLVLYFDVNQTIIMKDTVTSADSRCLLNEVVANASWGAVIEGRWELVSKAPELVAPQEGLITFCQFVRQTFPRKEQPKALRSFTELGCPGEALSAEVDRLLECQKLPPGAVAAADPDQLRCLGLTSGNFGLLPSFMLLLRWLKKQGRSFSVCFRTFGVDLNKLENEFNALCENTHPLFVAGSDWAKDARLALDPDNALQDVVLDGSDGAPDMRMNLASGSERCGSFIRGNDGLKIVIGEMRQPPKNKSHGSALTEFYAELPNDDTNATDIGCQGSAETRDKGVMVIEGEKAVRDRLRAILHQRSQGCTMALRDYYPAWDAAGRCAEAGKPFFVESKDYRILQVFWDDHILPKDAHIIDVRHADNPSQSSMPICAAWGMHVVRAEPLQSITNPFYFINSLKHAEEKWRVTSRRRRICADSLLNACDGHSALNSFKAASSPEATPTLRRYTSFSSSMQVLRRSDTNLPDEWEAMSSAWQAM